LERYLKNYISTCFLHQDKEQDILIDIRINSKESGGGVFWQPRRFPSDPELISIGNNVKIASNVIFINHDIAHNMLNEKFNTTDFKPLWGSIEIGNNVMIGAETIILPNVKIGSNVIIGAGSVITKDIPDNVVAAGVPCRVIGGFEQYVEKRKKGLKDRMKC